ncbi:MAG TPA: DUF4230 domain-containing protein [Anaerolineae bacterium]|nr:DUF4230 domain-containing protein [Anaerolineae bacterium]
MKNVSNQIGCTIQLLVVLLILIVALVVIQLASGFPGSLFNQPQATPVIFVQPSVIDQVKPLGQLHTASYFLSTVVDTQMHVGVLNQLQRVLLVACGKVNAGVDLQKMTAKDIKITGDKVNVHLPDPEIFDALLFDDRQCTYVVLRDEGILLPPNTQLESAAREAAVANFRATALQNDILNTALQNAKTQLRSLIILLGYTQVDFTPESFSND